MSNIAIITTLANAGDILHSFLTYHFSIGISHIFLFFDNKNDPAIRVAELFDNVSIVLNDSSLHKRWSGAKTFESVRDFIDEEIMSRQILNAELALNMAMEKGFDWLLHIDVDELFYLPNETLQQHLKFLSEYDIENIYYYNYEAVPESLNTRDHFLEVSLFKKSHHHLDKNQWNFLKELDRQGINWKFTAYTGGKSAVRVSDDILPHGVHEFIPGKRYYLKEVGPGTPQTPIILHYPECGFNKFWEKYRSLGNFPDKWFGEVDISERVPFRLKARDVVLQNDIDLAKKFYNDEVMMESDWAQKLVDAGIFHRTAKPGDIIKGHHQNRVL